MSQTEIALTLSIVGGFALLAATVFAFFLERQRAGVVLLVLAGAAFTCSLLFMTQFSNEWESGMRAEVRAKYAVTIQEWGAPLGSAPAWEVDNKVADCVVITKGPHAPVMTCDGEELPLRHPHRH
ncbi:hypothetical protein [Nocardioides sp.]|uniref:hypothetical protein n=1 Tax=Nocardioides sp. TaxID=35761 RepID=UPI0037837217